MSAPVPAGAPELTDPHRSTLTSQPEVAPTPVDPWERYGWVMGAIWLVFLAFPLIESFQADTAPLWRAASVLAIVAFAAVYVWGFIRFDTFDSWTQVQGFGVRVLVALALLTVVPALVIGTEALGMLPFLVAFAMFSLAVRIALAFGVAMLVVAVLVPLALGTMDVDWFFLVIVGLVFASTAIVRVLEERGSVHRELTQQMTIVSERERVARDVHDVLGHSLTVVTVKAELARRLVDVDPARAKHELDQIQSLTRTALAEIRATVAGLRVARIDDELASAAVALAGSGIEAELPDDPSVVDPRHRIVLAWVLREAVTNVVRHSGARRCVVRLESAGLLVEDDGVGRSVSTDGNGLRGVRERVTAAGGELVVGPGTGGSGTRLEVSL